jgi:hypothetical protein
MKYKTAFISTLFLFLGCALPLKTEVRETPRGERIIFYSDDGKEDEMGCVNIYKLMTESLAAKEAEKLLKGFISEGSHTLNQLKNEIRVLEFLTKLQNKIDEIEDTSKEGKENEEEKYIKETYPQLYSKLTKEFLEEPSLTKDEKMKQIKEDHLKFYQQFSLDLQALNYDHLKEQREEIVSIINRLGWKGKFRKIIDSSYGNTSGCQLDMTEDLMQIYNKVVENSFRDFRFYPCRKDKTWKVLITFLKSAGYIFQTIDEDKGIIKTQPVYFNPGERTTVTNTPSNLLKKDSAQLNANEHIDLITHIPAEKQGSWLTSKESLTIQVTPFSQNLTKVKIKLTIEACNDSEGWEVLISNKFTERNILNSLKKELLVKQ